MITENKMSGKQRELYNLMDHISQRCYWNRWLLGFENTLWDAAVNGKPSNLDKADLEKLATLAVECESWIVYGEDGPHAVPLDEWRVRCRALNKETL